MTQPSARAFAKRRGLLLAGLAVVLAAAVAGGYGLWYLFLRPSGPAAVGDAPIPVLPTAAVSSSPLASGGLGIDATKVTAVTVTADLTALRSDDDRRDGQLRRQGIQTEQFPTAVFNLTSPIDLRSIPVADQPISVTAKGTLTLHGVARDVQVPLTATLRGSTIVIQGSLPIAFADYGIEKPSSFAVLSIEDHGTMELQLFFTHA